MAVMDIMFIINFVILIGFTAFYFYKKQKKSAISNLIVLMLFVLVHLVENYYISIRGRLYEILGEDAFIALRDFIKVFLFFGISITVGIQLLSEILGLIILFYFAIKVIKLLKLICGKRYFTSVFSENEKVIDKFNAHYIRYYLIFERLLN